MAAGAPTQWGKQTASQRPTAGFSEMPLKGGGQRRAQTSKQSLEPERWWPSRAGQTPPCQSHLSQPPGPWGGPKDKKGLDAEPTGSAAEDRHPLEDEFRSSLPQHCLGTVTVASLNCIWGLAPSFLPPPAPHPTSPNLHKTCAVSSCLL